MWTRLVGIIVALMLVSLCLAQGTATLTRVSKSMTVRYALDDIPTDAWPTVLAPAVTASDAGDYVGALKATAQVLAQPGVDPKTAALAEILAGLASGMPPHPLKQVERDKIAGMLHRAVAFAAQVEGCPWLRDTAEILSLCTKAGRAGLTHEDAEMAMTLLGEYPESGIGFRAVLLLGGALQCLSPADTAKVAEALSALSSRSAETPIGKRNCYYALRVLLPFYDDNGMYPQEIAALQRAERDFPGSDLAKEAPRMIAEARKAMKETAH